MPRIQQLPPSVVTKIAAGEVIERPASVIKEMLENSIDAGATRLDIDLEQGGTELIRIVDDGHGIEEADLPLVFSSHATSKLRDADDLFRINTLGFRGEAMASIGGIAKVTLQSRAAGQATGAEIFCDGGELSPVKPWNGTQGTRIEVKHLFFNTPVRKKFLRTIATELGHVVESVTRIALAYPALHIVLKHNGKLVHEIPGSATLPDRIRLFFGKEVAEALLAVNGQAGGMTVTGVIADPACDRGNAKLQYFFLNGRWIRDRSITHALQEAYRGLLMTGRYAVGFLFLTVPPDQVDVNVHPTKCEVRFRDSQAIYHLVRGAIKRTLLAENLLPQLSVPDTETKTTEPLVRPETSETPALFVPQTPPRFDLATKTIAPWEQPPPPPPVVPVVPGPTPFPMTPPLPAFTPTTVYLPPTPEPAPQVAPEPLPLPPTPPPPTVQPAPLPTTPARAIQIHDAYLVVETPQGMLVIDQHALHERILYEQLRHRVREGRLDAQRLLIPEPFDLTLDQAAAVMEAKEQLLELGLDVEDFGGGTVAVSSYPALLNRVPVAHIFQSVVDVLITKDRAPTRDQLFNHLLATMACKAAVKAGDHLTPDEIDYLMHLREMAEDSHHCPHGRPTSLVFSRQELDKQFKRI